MKKNVFFNRFNAKNALSCVALGTAMLFASCQKESFSVGTPNTPVVNDAVMYITASVFDATTSEAISGLTYTWTGNGTADANSYSITPASDKTIAAGTATLATSGVEAYLSTETTIAYPQLAAGAVKFIPVTVFATSVEAALDGKTEILEGTDVTTENEAAAATEAEANTTNLAKEMDLTFVGKSGQTVENLATIEAEINAGTNGLAATRSISDDNKKALLIGAVRGQNIGIKNTTFTMKNVTVPANSTTKITNIVEYSDGTYTIEVAIEGVTYQITGVKIKKVVANTASAVAITVDSHGNSHSQDLHGGSFNAGGGIAGK